MVDWGALNAQRGGFAYDAALHHAGRAGASQNLRTGSTACRSLSRSIRRRGPATCSSSLPRSVAALQRARCTPAAATPACSSGSTSQRSCSRSRSGRARPRTRGCGSRQSSGRWPTACGPIPTVEYLERLHLFHRVNQRPAVVACTTVEATDERLAEIEAFLRGPAQHEVVSAPGLVTRELYRLIETGRRHQAVTSWRSIADLERFRADDEQRMEVALTAIGAAL